MFTSDLDPSEISDIIMPSHGFLVKDVLIPFHWPLWNLFSSNKIHPSPEHLVAPVPVNLDSPYILWNLIAYMYCESPGILWQTLLPQVPSTPEQADVASAALDEFADTADTLQINDQGIWKLWREIWFVATGEAEKFKVHPRTWPKL